MLTIALTATVCGAESCVDSADFARDREALFHDFLELPGDLPSHDTFSRLFRLPDPQAFAACFARFLDRLGEAGPGVIAIDGKTLRRSFDRAAGQSVLHVVTAFAADARMVIGQVAASIKESEIIAARTLLGLIDIKRALVTGDALHCLGETARIITKRGGDWLFTLKADRDGRSSTLRRFYLSSARMDAERFAAAVRVHWRIETSLIGYSRSGSTSIAPETAVATAPKTSPHSENSPSTSSVPQNPKAIRMVR